MTPQEIQNIQAANRIYDVGFSVLTNNFQPYLIPEDEFGSNCHAYFTEEEAESFCKRMNMTDKEKEKHYKNLVKQL